MDVGRSRSDETVERGTVIAGRYVVDDLIARTALSAVYRVEHVHTGERLAMKILGGSARFDPQATQRFKQEARTSSRIRSEHVVLVTDADTAPELDGAPFMVMELLRGVDLETYALRHGPLAPDVVVPLLAQVASVLEQAHRLGIIHRDLKPENLFLHERADGTSIAKVLDFGISKFVSTAETNHAIAVTSTGAVLGTPLYMSPEQAHGKNDEIGPTTDVWAMGLIAMRLLAGEHYWGRPTMAELMMKITVAPIVAPSERWPNMELVAPPLDAWFLRSCDRDRQKRWPSITEQMTALAAALDVPLPESASAALPRIDRTPPPPAASPVGDVDALRLAIDDTERAPPRVSGAPDAASGADVLARSVSARPGGPSATRRSRALLASAAALVLLAGGPWLLRGGTTPTDEARGERTTAALSRASEPPPSIVASAEPPSTASSGEPTPSPVPIASESAAPSNSVARSKASEGQRPIPVRSGAPSAAAAAPAAPAASPSSPAKDSVISCGEGEVLSLGRCCPSGHVWQSGRCARPVATSF